MIFRAFWGLRTFKRHSLILVVAGFIYALIGVSQILAPSRSARGNSLEVLLRIAPLGFWGGVFVAAGILCIISSVWPPHSETWGYMVLTGLSLGWGSAYLMGILFAGAPWTNINGFLVWGMMGFIWWAVSGLSNPDAAVVVVTDDSRPA